MPHKNSFYAPDNQHDWYPVGTALTREPEAVFSMSVEEAKEEIEKLKVPVQIPDGTSAVIAVVKDYVDRLWVRFEFIKGEAGESEA